MALNSGSLLLRESMDAMAMEVRHGCKVCWKSFSSGRSLGGHMRSHLSLGEAAAEGDAAAAELVRASANGVRSSRGVVEYGLRENPRKTRRLSDFAADDDDENGGDGDGDGDGEHKVCRECGKLFASWSSLFGHMRSHASGVRDRDGDEDVGMEEEFVPEEVEAKEAEMVAAAMEAPVLAQAAVTEPRRRRRTMRVAAPPPAPSPVLYGFEKEQEDVALCLLMLSRDTALWSSPAKEAPPLGNAKKKKQTGLLRSGNAYNPDDDSALLQHGDAKIKGRRRSSPKQQRDAAEPKRTRYECPGCGKVFSSYQALGGHRASHKRINTSCSAAKEAPGAAGTAASPAPEPSTETYASCSTLPPSASPDSVVSGFARSKAQAVAEAAVEKFECQEALGGHGLSHLMPADDGELYAGGAGQELEQHSAAAAGFLDLNFPLAPPEEA